MTVKEVLEIYEENRYAGWKDFLLGTLSFLGAYMPIRGIDANSSPEQIVRQIESTHYSSNDENFEEFYKAGDAAKGNKHFIGTPAERTKNGAHAFGLYSPQLATIYFAKPTDTKDGLVYHVTVKMLIYDYYGKKHIKEFDRGIKTSEQVIMDIQKVFSAVQ